MFFIVQTGAFLLSWVSFLESNYYSLMQHCTIIKSPTNLSKLQTVWDKTKTTIQFNYLLNASMKPKKKSYRLNWAQVVNELFLGQIARENPSSTHGGNNFWLDFTYLRRNSWLPGSFFLGNQRVNTKKKCNWHLLSCRLQSTH
jgi:hypothetical protein